MTPKSNYGETNSNAASLNDLEARLANIPIDEQYHYVPSRFDPKDTWALFPFDLNHRIRLLADFLHHEHATASVVVVPPFLQLDQLIYWTQKDAGIPHATTSPSQSMVAMEMMSQLNATVMIATPATARALDTALMSNPKACWPHNWYIIQPFMSRERYVPSRGTVFYDFQYLPGLSAAYQCDILVRDGRDRFHPSPDCTWNTFGGTLMFTSHQRHSLTIQNIFMGSGTIENALCDCGKNSIISLYV